jgi:hypothetical protein
MMFVYTVSVCVSVSVAFVTTRQCSVSQSGLLNIWALCIVECHLLPVIKLLIMGLSIRRCVRSSMKFDGGTLYF